MKHPLIKQIHKDKTTVLCVVKGVITTSDKAEIKRTDNTDGNIKVLEKVNQYFFKCNTISLHHYFRIISHHDESRSSGPLVLQSSGPPVLQSSGPPVLWSSGPPVLQSSGPPVLQSSSPRPVKFCSHQ